MFGFFKKRDQEKRHLRKMSDALFTPMATSLALEKVAREYSETLAKHGEKLPAHKQDIGVLGIWKGTRIEFYMALMSRGADLAVFGDLRQQPEIFRLYQDEKCHLSMPVSVVTHTDDPLHRALSTLMYGYMHLSQAGEATADSKTSKTSLKLKGNDILSDLDAAVSKARARWNQVLHGTERDDEIPPTMIEIIDTDVRTKSKSIALSARFGPYNEEGIRHLETLLRKDNRTDEANAFRRGIDRVLAADDPDKCEI